MLRWKAHVFQDPLDNLDPRGAVSVRIHLRRHGTAFDIAGKNKADVGSFLAAVYGCLDIVQKRKDFTENHKNPLKKMGSVVLAGAEDEKIDES